MTFTGYDLRFLHSAGVAMDDGTAPLTFTIEDYQRLVSQLQQDVIACIAETAAVRSANEQLETAFERQVARAEAAERRARKASVWAWGTAIVAAMAAGVALWR